MRQQPGRLIVVGGHTRGIGKTAVVAHLLRTLGWAGAAAVKISAHRHATGPVAPVMIEEAREASPETQTGRYLAAGAARAWLCRCPATRLPEAAAFIDALRARGHDVLVESNRIVDVIEPDLLLFVVSARIDDWKASSAACLQRADALVLSPGSAGVPDTVWRLAAPRTGPVRAFGLTADWAAPGLTPWVGRRLPRLPQDMTDVMAQPVAAGRRSGHGR